MEHSPSKEVEDKTVENIKDVKLSLLENKFIKDQCEENEIIWLDMTLIAIKYLKMKRGDMKLRYGDFENIYYTIQKERYKSGRLLKFLLFYRHSAEENLKFILKDMKMNKIPQF